ncbi:hypothetical protein [Kiloniella sp.]|uniref:hypothetical protein n=1 Tax=Kiloniella sp. TaxID=1938587 RepID=UPI003B018F18
MAIKNRIAEFKAEMTEWRRHLHANPELALQEEETSAYVAEKLTEWGIEIHRGLPRRVLSVFCTVRIAPMTLERRLVFVLIWMPCRCQN